MPSKLVHRFLDSAGPDYEPAQLNALFLNVIFKNGKLVCTTGVSMRIFTLDKSLETAWDEQMQEFLLRMQE